MFLAVLLRVQGTQTDSYLSPHHYHPKTPITIINIHSCMTGYLGVGVTRLEVILSAMGTTEWMPTVLDLTPTLKQTLQETGLEFNHI